MTVMENRVNGGNDRYHNSGVLPSASIIFIIPHKAKDTFVPLSLKFFAARFDHSTLFGQRGGGGLPPSLLLLSILHHLAQLTSALIHRLPTLGSSLCGLVAPTPSDLCILTHFQGIEIFYNLGGDRRFSVLVDDDADAGLPVIISSMSRTEVGEPVSV